MTRQLPMVFYTCNSGIDGTGAVVPMDPEGEGSLKGSMTVTLRSTVPDCRGLDPDVARAEWCIEVGRRAREGAMPLVQTGTVATFNLADEIVQGMEPGETGLILGVTIKGLDQQGGERVSSKGGVLIREPGVIIAAVPDPENPGKEQDLLESPDFFTLHEGILLFRAEPRHMRHRPFPYFVFSVKVD